MCQVGRNHLSYSDLKMGFTRCDMLLDAGLGGELFDEADEDADGMLTLHEWTRFAGNNTSLVDALYFRMKDLYSSRQAASRGGVNHITSTGCLSDPRVTARSPQLTQPKASEKLLLAQEVQRASMEAEVAREAHRCAERKELAAKTRLHACYG